MRFQFFQLAAVTVVLAIALTGCGKKRRGDSSGQVEGVDGVAMADTANIDSMGSAESLPTIDQGDAGKTPTPNDDANVMAAPSGETAPAPMDGGAPPAVQGSGTMTNYTVQKGDTLMKIAFTLYGDINQWRNIYDWNKDSLKSANQLTEGTQLKYDKPMSEPMIEKNGEPYMIKKGDTLGTIADDIYAKKSKWKKIYENNRSLIRDANRIYAGFYLYYQITEEEKSEAEAIRAKRGGTLGGGNTSMPDSAGHKAGKDALKGGGLNNLADPSGERVPASE